MFFLSKRQHNFITTIFSNEFSRTNKGFPLIFVNIPQQWLAYHYPMMRYQSEKILYASCGCARLRFDCNWMVVRLQIQFTTINNINHVLLSTAIVISLYFSYHKRTRSANKDLLQIMQKIIRFSHLQHLPCGGLTRKQIQRRSLNIIKKYYVVYFYLCSCC